MQVPSLVLGTCCHRLVYSGAWDPQIAGTGMGASWLLGIVGKQSCGDWFGGVLIPSLPVIS